jgi:hypothetical protein
VRNSWRGQGGRGLLISLFWEGSCARETQEVFLRWEPRFAWLKSDKVCPTWYENEILDQYIKITFIDRDTPTFCLAPVDPPRHRGGITRNYLLLQSGGKGVDAGKRCRRSALFGRMLSNSTFRIVRSHALNFSPTVFWFTFFFLLFAWFYFCISFAREQYICATIRCQKFGTTAIKIKNAILCLSVFFDGESFHDYLLLQLCTHNWFWRLLMSSLTERFFTLKMIDWPWIWTYTIIKHSISFTMTSLNWVWFNGNAFIVGTFRTQYIWWRRWVEKAFKLCVGDSTDTLPTIEIVHVNKKWFPLIWWQIACFCKEH